MAFGPIVGWLLLNRESFNPYLLLPIIIFPLVNGYVILRFRLLRTDNWLRKGIVYSALTILVVAAYALLVSGLGSTVGEMVSYFLGWGGRKMIESLARAEGFWTWYGRLSTSITLVAMAAITLVGLLAGRAGVWGLLSLVR